jgi:predicted secreted protein
MSTNTTTTASGTTTLTEADNGHDITVRPGDALVVVLHSTYWSFATADETIVASDGPTTVTPDLQGCVPGGGCGTVTGHFHAVATGHATLSAHRDSCGEALACTPEQGNWNITVDVSA